MKALRVAFRLVLLLGFVIEITALSATAQTTPPKKAQPPTPALRKLTGDDARRVDDLDKAIEAALKADRWDEAVARAEELLALRSRVQGPKYFETADAEWVLKTLRHLSSMPKEDRVAYQSASTMNRAAETLYAQGKYAQAQPLLEKALDVRRRVLTDDHPLTASSYENVGVNLDAQGKYAQAQPLHEKALEIRRRLLTDDSVNIAASYNNLAYNLNGQAKYAQSPAFLYEKAASLSPPVQRRPTRHCQSLQQPGAEPPIPGEIRRGPAALREGAGDHPPPAHRRPPQHSQNLQLPGVQPQRAGEVLPSPATL